MIEIYTDASVGKSHAVTACIVLTDKNYIGYKTFASDNVSNSILGELLGAINAVKSAEDMLDLHNDNVTLYVDNIALLNLLKCDLTYTSNKQAQRYSKELRELRDLVHKYSIDMRLIRGHKIDHNPNKVVDLISNSMLRYSK